MFRSGTFVAEHISPVSADQIQPNGVDLRLDAVFEQTGVGRIDRDGKEIGDRKTLDDASGVYHLDTGTYVVRYAETVHIPAGHIGFIYPRSSLLRNSCMLNTAVWDAGYEGRGEGLLQVHHPIDVERDARIAQMVLSEANHGDTYDGSYQGENID